VAVACPSVRLCTRNRTAETACLAVVAVDLTYGDELNQLRSGRDQAVSQALKNSANATLQARPLSLSGPNLDIGVAAERLLVGRPERDDPLPSGVLDPRADLVRNFALQEDRLERHWHRCGFPGRRKGDAVAVHAMREPSGRRPDAGGRSRSNHRSCPETRRPWRWESRLPTDRSWISSCDFWLLPDGDGVVGGRG
jgi:hypothetical protein